MRGKFILIFGPTGSGKSVLIEHIRTTFPELKFVKSYTTRARRSALENASYEFISEEAFDALIADGSFAEYASFGSARYGTKREDVEQGIEEGGVIIKEMELQGVRQILGSMPREDLRVFYVDAGSWDELERRARLRGSITDEELEKRKIRYEDEQSSQGIADVKITNAPDELDEAKRQLEAAIRGVLDEVH